MMVACQQGPQQCFVQPFFATPTVLFGSLPGSESQKMLAFFRQRTIPFFLHFPEKTTRFFLGFSFVLHGASSDHQPCFLKGI
jgi:hypothetical protein